MADVTKLIEQDHRTVEGLFAQFKSDHSKDTALTICQEIEAHATAEEKVFYPVVRDDVPQGAGLRARAKTSTVKRARSSAGSRTQTRGTTSPIS